MTEQSESERASLSPPTTSTTATSSAGPFLAKVLVFIEVERGADGREAYDAAVLFSQSARFTPGVRDVSVHLLPEVAR